MINQLQLANTFNEWRITTNDLIGIANDLKEGNLQTTGTVTIDNLNGYRNNIALNVSSGMIRGDGGLLSNTGAIGSIKNDRLQNNSITINWNNSQIALSSNTINLGQAVFLNVTNLATRVNDTSTANIASANAVNAVHAIASFANTVSNYSIARINAVSDSTNSAYVLANTTATTLNSTGNTLTNTTFTAIAAFNFANTRYSANGGTIIGDVTINGNLTVAGSSVASLLFNDPLLYLASNNYVSDVVDIGFVGNYNNGACTTIHTGVFRDAVSKEWFVFEGYDKEPGSANHIDPNGNNFTVSILNATLRTSNIILNGINAHTWIRSSFNAANAVFNQSNNVYGVANASFAAANAAYSQGNAVYALTNVSFTAANAAFTRANNSLSNVAAQAGATFTGNLTTTGVVIDPRGADIRTKPIVSPGAVYGLSRKDLGNTISVTATVFLPNAVFTAGDYLTIFNNSAAVVPVVPNTNVTLYRSNASADVTSTSRNLNAYAVATIHCVAANTFVISGHAVTA